MRLPLRDEQKALTRSRLLEAAETIFEKAGYIAASVDQIAEAAGVSRATVYLHFSNKEEILRELLGRTAPGVEASMRQLDIILAGGTSVQFVSWLDDTVRWLEQHRVHLFVMAEASLTDGNIASEYAAYVNNVSSELLPRYIGRWPKRRREEAEFRVKLLVMQLNRLAIQWDLWKSIEKDRARSIELLRELWWPFLQPPR